MSPVQIVMFASDPDHMLVEGYTTKNTFCYHFKCSFFFLCRLLTMVRLGKPPVA